MMYFSKTVANDFEAVEALAEPQKRVQMRC